MFSIHALICVAVKESASTAREMGVVRTAHCSACIQGNGWRRSIVVSKRSGFIIKGHGAWQTAMRRGWDVPVEFQAYRNAAEEHRDMVADNKLHELAETDETKLAKLLAGIDVEELALTGFDSAELERMLQDATALDAEFPITAKLNESYDYVLIFTDNASDAVFLQTLCGVRTERSYKKTGVGIGRAVPFKRFLSSIRENRHSLNVQGDHDDNTPARSERGRRRPRKSAR
jgi:hypothetical protein